MRSLGKALRSFHEDEDGLEALQVVMIVAISAVILLVIVKLWPRVKTWFDGATKNIVDDPSMKDG